MVQPFSEASARNPDTIVSTLRTRLSPNASIYLPSSQGFRDAVQRWSEYNLPDIQVAVLAANEKDVQEAVRFANELGVPFLAKTNGHGTISSLGKISKGLLIWLRNLNYVRVSEDGRHATVGGGVLNGELIDALCKVGKRTVTGNSNAVSVTGPMLGAGRGNLQGQHGSIADQLVEARLVLADGSAITVSQHSHPDLFWAIRGAGHNFGIMTQFTVKVYDIVPPRDVWSLYIFTYTQDKSEALYQLLNKMMPTIPPTFNVIQRIGWNREIDASNPVLTTICNFNGPPEDAREWVAPIEALEPHAAKLEVVPMDQFNDILSPIRATEGLSIIRFPIYLPNFNVTAMRHAIESLKRHVEDEPAFEASHMLAEMLSEDGVAKIPREDTAYAHRGEPVLISMNVYYKSNRDFDPVAIKFGTHVREIFRHGSGRKELLAYVNYASGNEQPESLYGYEPWRMQKLRRLKKQYDPQNKFGFFGSIYETQSAGDRDGNFKL